MHDNTRITLSVSVGVFLLMMLAIGGAAWYVTQNVEGWLDAAER